MCHNKTVVWSEGLEPVPPLDPSCLWHYRVSWAQFEESFLVTSCCCDAGQGKCVLVHQEHSWGCSQRRSQALHPLSSGKSSIALGKPKHLHAAGSQAMCTYLILSSPTSNPSVPGSTGCLHSPRDVSGIPQWPCSATKDRTPESPLLPQTGSQG